jgi:dolichol-phosphate mannosyltransferase
MISVVVPVYNEEENLPELLRRLMEAADGWAEEFRQPAEFLFIDDGSHDAGWEMLRGYAERDERVRALRFSRNFGHQPAVTAGLDHARGDAVVVMDADLQDPPEVVERLVRKWGEGFEVVYAVRRARKENAGLRFSYWLFYRVLNGLTDVPIPADSGDFCLMDRRVVEVLRELPERTRFIRGLRAWAGFRQVSLEYERQGRAAGEAKYNLRGLVKLALDGITSFSYRPLRLFSYLGILLAWMAFLCLLVLAVGKIFQLQFTGYNLGNAPDFLFLFLAIVFMGGVQMLGLGLIGEYIGRIYEETKHRPVYILRDHLPGAESGVAEKAGSHGLAPDAGEGPASVS